MERIATLVLVVVAFGVSAVVAFCVHAAVAKKCMSIIIRYFLNHGRSKCALPTLISWKFRYIPLMLCI